MQDAMHVLHVFFRSSTSPTLFIHSYHVSFRFTLRTITAAISYLFPCISKIINESSHSGKQITSFSHSSFSILGSFIICMSLYLPVAKVTFTHDLHISRVKFFPGSRSTPRSTGTRRRTAGTTRKTLTSCNSSNRCCHPTTRTIKTTPTTGRSPRKAAFRWTRPRWPITRQTAVRPVTPGCEGS